MRASNRSHLTEGTKESRMRTLTKTEAQQTCGAGLSMLTSALDMGKIQHTLTERVASVVLNPDGGTATVNTLLGSRTVNLPAPLLIAVRGLL
jgi:hypothetical protein